MLSLFSPPRFQSRSQRKKVMKTQKEQERRNLKQKEKSMKRSCHNTASLLKLMMHSCHREQKISLLNR